VSKRIWLTDNLTIVSHDKNKFHLDEMTMMMSA